MLGGLPAHANNIPTKMSAQESATIQLPAQGQTGPDPQPEPLDCVKGPETAAGAHTVRPSPLCGMFSAYP